MVTVEREMAIGLRFHRNGAQRDTTEGKRPLCNGSGKPIRGTHALSRYSFVAISIRNGTIVAEAAKAFGDFSRPFQCFPPKLLASSATPKSNVDNTLVLDLRSPFASTQVGFARKNRTKP